MKSTLLKLVIVAVMAISLVASLAACGGDSTTSEVGSKAPVTSDTASEAASEAASAAESAIVSETVSETVSAVVSGVVSE